MGCPYCKQGTTRPGRVTVVLERGETLVIFKEVPGNVCDCGEYFLSREVTGQLLNRAEEAIHEGTEVAIRRFRSAAWEVSPSPGEGVLGGPGEGAGG